jgi:hypothetical protein
MPKEGYEPASVTARNTMLPGQIFGLFKVSIQDEYPERSGKQDAKNKPGKSQ